jgi:hypothetical protein
MSFFTKEDVTRQTQVLSQPSQSDFSNWRSVLEEIVNLENA